MENRVIQWRLREVMDRHGIQAKDLATEMGVSRNAVSNLRAFEMPRIDGDRLNQLIVSLNRLRKAKNSLITPSDLIGFTLSPEEMQKIGIH